MLCGCDWQGVYTIFLFPCCYRLEKLFPLGLRVVIGKRSGCMSSSPRLELIEKVRNSAAKKMEAASEALLKAREAGEGPVFSDDQNTNLATLCKQKYSPHPHRGRSSRVSINNLFCVQTRRPGKYTHTGRLYSQSQRWWPRHHNTSTKLRTVG